MSLIMSGTFVMLSGCGGRSVPASRPGAGLDRWHVRNPLPAGVILSRISYGDGLFVGFGGQPSPVRAGSIGE